MSESPEEQETDLDSHISKREVIEAFNQMGRQWNQAFANLHNKIEHLHHNVEQLNKEFAMSDVTNEQRFLADEKTIDSLTRAVSITFADLSAEFQSLQGQAQGAGQVTAADLDGFETKLASLGSAIGGLSGLAPATPAPTDGSDAATDGGAETPVTDSGATDATSTDTTTPAVPEPLGADGSGTAASTDPETPVVTEPTNTGSETPAVTDTSASTEVGSVDGGTTVVDGAPAEPVAEAPTTDESTAG